MGLLKEMPVIELDTESLKEWGATWLGTVGSPKKQKKKTDPVVATVKKANCFDKKQGMDFGNVFDFNSHPLPITQVIIKSTCKL